MPGPIRAFGWSTAQTRASLKHGTGAWQTRILKRSSWFCLTATTYGSRPPSSPWFAGSTERRVCRCARARLLHRQPRETVGRRRPHGAHARAEGVRRSRDQIAAPRRTHHVRRARGPELDRDTRPPPHEARHRRTRRRVRSDRRPADDWDFAIRLSRYGDVAFIDCPLLQWRRHGTSLTNSSPRWRRAPTTAFAPRRCGIRRTRGSRSASPGLRISRRSKARCTAPSGCSALAITTPRFGRWDGPATRRGS